MANPPSTSCTWFSAVISVVLRLSGIFFLPVTTVIAHIPEPETPRITQSPECLKQLDALVSLASNEQDNSEYMVARFELLESECPTLPQLAHNLGVLAAEAEQWPDAIAHFQRSLTLDKRAAATHRHLQQIFENRAAQAYALALNTPVDVAAPVLEYQDSSDLNAEAEFQSLDTAELHNISTLEYEMFAWWQSIQNSIGLREHYVDEFPPAAIWLSKQKYANRQWADMDREIAFTSRDAVVILSDPYHNRTLFLLRLIGTRWKIYQETDL